MKTPSLAIGITAVSFGLGLTFVSGLSAADESCKIRVQAAAIVMPLTNLDPKDKEALDGLLKQYDESLYKIVTFENGVRKEERGSLDNKFIRERGAIERLAKDSKASGEAVQIGGIFCTPGCNHYQSDVCNLVSRVEELLKKYCPPKK
jgi:hypothetical protein